MTLPNYASPDMSPANAAEQIQCLQKMRGLLEEEGSWCRGAMGRNANGQAVSPLSPSAVMFDLYGAELLALGDHPTEFLSSLKQAKRALWPDDRYGAIADWQDQPERKHSEILALLDKAIELCRKAVESTATAIPEA